MASPSKRRRRKLALIKKLEELNGSAVGSFAAGVAIDAVEVVEEVVESVAEAAEDITESVADVVQDVAEVTEDAVEDIFAEINKAAKPKRKKKAK